MKILLLLTLLCSNFVWAGEPEDYIALGSSRGLSVTDLRARYASRVNWIEGKVTMIDDRVNGLSVHYVIVRLTNVKIDGGGAPDTAVVFAVLKDINNAANFPELMKKQYYQGQHCLDLAKQAFASGKKFFIAKLDNGAEIVKGPEGTWYADGLPSYIVHEIAGPLMMAPGRCGIMN